MFPLVLAMAEEDSDTEYIHAVYMQYSLLMLAIARRFVQTKYDQEEVISDAIVALIKNSATLRTLQGDKLPAYIATTVKNKARDYLAKQNTLKRRCVPIEDISHFLVDSSCNMEHRIMLGEEIKLVSNAINDLPKKEMQVFLLKYAYDMDTYIIAEIVGISKESVSKYLRRAKEKIKAKVYGRMDGNE